jgi:hypothetical protein
VGVKRSAAYDTVQRKSARQHEIANAVLHSVSANGVKITQGDKGDVCIVLGAPFRTLGVENTPRNFAAACAWLRARRPK